MFCRVWPGIGIGLGSWSLGLALLVQACGDEAPKPASQQLPCEVERLVVSRCQGCHGDPTMFGAPMSLKTVNDFHAPAPSDEAKQVYELVSDHLHGTKSVMPPLPNVALSKTELAVLDDWLESAAPPAAGKEECAL